MTDILDSTVVDAQHPWRGPNRCRRVADPAQQRIDTGWEPQQAQHPRAEVPTDRKADLTLYLSKALGLPCPGHGN